MKATLFIEIELLEPTIIASVAQMLDLHPSQIRSVSIRLKPDETAEGDPSIFSAQVENSRIAIYNLISLAQRSQPEGTMVTVWFQGRFESFHV